MEIYITGIGVNTSIGSNAPDFWDGLVNKKHGVKKISLFDVSHHSNKVGCEIENPYDKLPPSSNTFGRATTIFLSAFEDAIYDAGLDIEDLKIGKVGISVGTTMGEVEPFEKSQVSKQQKGGPHLITEQLYRLYGLKGPKWTFTNACAAGNFAIARAMEDLRTGRADVVVAGGVDALSLTAFTGFSSLRAMSPDLCRPFDAHRKGLILGEGAGVLVLETKKTLEKRGGRARAQLLGYGLNCDSHHITQPDPQARGAIKAMETALLMGNVSKESIRYVSAHGTGTMANDHMESKALSELFDDRISTSSIKGNIGHTLGAASAIEAIVCTKILETSIIPPTLHLENQDPQCSVEVIAREPVYSKNDYVLSNAFAFGGINSSLLLGKA